MKKLLKPLALAAVVAAITESSVFAAGGADKICHDPALSQQEQTLCMDQIAAAQSVPEQKAIQTKFRDRIAARKKSK